MLRFLDKVRVKVKPETRIIAPGQQVSLFFAGHEGTVIGQKKDLSYAVWFSETIGFPEPIVESFPEADLELLENKVLLLQESDMP